MASSSLLFTHLAWIWISWYLNLHSDKESSLCLPKVSGTKPDHVCSKTLTWNTIWQAMLGYLDSPASDCLVFQAGAQFTSWSLPRHNSFNKMNLIGALLLGTSFLPILNLSLFWYKTELYAFNKFLWGSNRMGSMATRYLGIQEWRKQIQPLLSSLYSVGSE